jgi:serine protease AprX
VCFAVLGLLATGAVGALPADAAQAPPADAPVHLVISGQAGQLSSVVRAVARAHGRVTRTLPLIDGVSADVPSREAAGLSRAAGVRGVTRDEHGHLLSVNSTLGYDPDADTGGLNAITQIVDAQSAWKSGYTGQGIDVALIDSGVAPVQGLTSGNVVNGPDLSFDSQNPNGTLYVDEFGHGTHMASLIAGRDKVQNNKGMGYVNQSGSGFVGVAPDARVINLKVASADGGADVSQVIAAINWVTQHAHDPGLNIRVLSLSYGTKSTQSYTLDPLAYAAEQAWRKGIFVVVAGGNDGATDTSGLADPAMDPLVMAVGADDPNGTVAVTDDFVPTFATHGTNTRHVDVVAPAVHVLGLRVPGSYVDANNPNAAVGTRFIRGSGTSQATAIVAGAAAVVLQKYPSMTPNVLKSSLTLGAVPISGSSATYRGSGLINIANSLAAGGSNANQPATASTGTGSLEAARGGSHVVNSTTGVSLTGEYDAFGKAWNGTTWAAAVANNSSWNGGTWNGSDITGSDWSGTSWAGNSWLSHYWTANLWDGTSWSSHYWTSHYWTSTGWNSQYWTDSSWASQYWTDNSWSSAGWQ